MVGIDDVLATQCQRSLYWNRTQAEDIPSLRSDYVQGLQSRDLSRVIWGFQALCMGTYSTILNAYAYDLSK